MVRAEHNMLIYIRKNFCHSDNFRHSNRQMCMAFDFKRRIGRSGNSLLSETIDIDRTISLGSAVDMRHPDGRKTTVSLTGVKLSG